MKNQDFLPVILHRENSFCVYLAEWNISGEGKTIEEAYRKYEEQKQLVEERAKKFGLATISSEPYPKLKRAQFLQEFGLFFAKISTAAFAVIFVAILLLPHITAAVRSNLMPRMDDALNRLAIELPEKINARLDRVSPEQEKKMTEEWGKLMKRTAQLRNKISGGSGN